jgi:hypothetical protein
MSFLVRLLVGLSVFLSPCAYDTDPPEAITSHTMKID